MPSTNAYTVFYQETRILCLSMSAACVGNIELAITQGARERQKKDVSIYSGNHVVNSLPHIIHPN